MASLSLSVFSSPQPQNLNVFIRKISMAVTLGTFDSTKSATCALSFFNWNSVKWYFAYIVLNVLYIALYIIERVYTQGAEDTFHTKYIKIYG